MKTPRKSIYRALLCLALFSLASFSFIDDGSKIVLDQIRFEPNSIYISGMDEGTRKYLDEVSEQVKEEMAKSEQSVVLIHGHSDRGPDQVLSMMRAFSVQSQLNERGIKNVFGIGHGSSSRVSDEKGNVLNRRVELEVIQTDTKFSPDSKDPVLIIGKQVFWVKEDFNTAQVFGAAVYNKGPGSSIVLQAVDGSEHKWQIPLSEEMQQIKIEQISDASGEPTLKFYVDHKLTKTLENGPFNMVGFQSESGQLEIEHCKIFEIVEKK